MENILINFVADPSGLQPGIDGLVEMEAVDRELADQVKKTTTVFEKQNKTISDGTKQTSSQLDKLTNSFKGLDKSIAGGSYTKALKGLQGEIENTSDEFKQLQIAIAFAKKQMDKLDPNTEEWKQLNDQVEAGTALLEAFGQQGEQVEKQSQSMRARLRELKTELQQLEDQGLDNTARFQELAVEAARLDDQIGDTNARIAALASDTADIDAAIQGIQTLAAGFQVGAGAAALFGEENEDLQKVLVKLNAIMAVTNGIREIQQSLQAQSILRLRLESAGQQVLAGSTAATAAVFKFFGRSVEQSATSFKVLRGAMLGLGIGALIAILGFAADAMGLFGEKTDDADAALDAFNSSIELSNAKLDKQIKNLERELVLRTNLLKKQGAGEKELTDATIDNSKQREAIYQQEAKTRNEGFKKSLTEGIKFAKTLPEFTIGLDIKDFDKLSKEGIPTLKEADALLEKLANIKAGDVYKDFSKSAQKNFDAVIERAKKVQDVLSLSDDEQFKQTEELTTFEAEKAEERRRKDKEAAEKRKRDLQADLKAEFELLKIEKQKQIDFLNNQATSEGGASVRENAFRKALILEEEILIAQRDLQLKNEQLTGKERQLIKQQTADALIAIEVDYGTRISGVQAAIAAEAVREQEALTQIIINEALKQKKALEDALKKTGRAEGEEEFAEIKGLLGKYKEGLIGKEAYEKGKKDIHDKYAKKNLENELFYLETVRENNNLPAEEIAAIEERLYQVKKELRDKDLEDQEAAKDKEIAIAEEKALRKQQILELAQNTAINLVQFAQGIAMKGYKAEEERIKELYDQKRISETEYNNQLKDLKRKQAADEKAMAVFTTLVNQGPMAVKAFAQGGFPAVAAAFGLFFSLLAAVSSTDVPQFKKGKVRIKGPGTQTSDSIHARISKDESVINAAATIKHEEVLKAINEDRYGAYVVQHELPKYYQNLTMPVVPDVQTTTHAPIDYDRLITGLAGAIEGMPRPGVSIDENGLKAYLQEGNALTEYKNKKLNL